MTTSVSPLFRGRGKGMACLLVSYQLTLLWSAIQHAQDKTTAHEQRSHTVKSISQRAPSPQLFREANLSQQKRRHRSDWQEDSSSHPDPSFQLLSPYLGLSDPTVLPPSKKRCPFRQMLHTCSCKRCPKYTFWLNIKILKLGMAHAYH